MAYTLDAQTCESYELGDYLEYIRANVDLADEDSVKESALALRRLANNRKFIAEHINAQLSSWKTFESANRYSAQTLMLGRGDGFFVRANIWEPPDPAMDADSQNRLYSYKVPHDHNFSFMTVGYLGQGYETEIYEYDRDSIAARLGAKAHLRFLERTTLPEGKVMMYRACKDVHVQEHAKDFSVSLNLMINPVSVYDTDQFYFDLEEDQITDYVSSSSSARVLLCRMAAHVGNSESASLLDHIGNTHKSPRLRMEALQALAALEPSARDYVSLKVEQQGDLPDNLQIRSF